jgi:outer membrane protein OmpA-like peptidoglycan-associated protein
MLPAIVAAVVLFGALAAAQDQTPKWEFFGGYSFIYPNSTVHGQLPLGLFPISSPMEGNPRGFAGSVTYDVNRWLGFTLDGSGHWRSGESTVFKKIDDAGFYNVSFGPKATFRRTHFAPFVEALAGWHRLSSDQFGSDDRVGFLLGAGIDVPLTRHFGLRLLQGDYVISDHHYGPTAVVPGTHFRGVRLQSGLTFMFGGGAPAQTSAACSVNPGEVFSGEPVTATATPSNYNPNHSLHYAWSSNGGKVSGNQSTTTIDTAGLAGGSYTVSARVSDPKAKGSDSSCSSSFTVKQVVQAKNPPTVSCSANPATVRSGESSTISCDCKSPDNRPVTLSSWTASSGRVSGTGSSATLDTAGVAPGSITVGATCADDRGLSAAGSAAVNVEAPPEKPVASKLTDIPFKRNNARVNNDAKGALDGVADRLLQDPNAKAVIVGETAAGEQGGTRLAAQRAVNAKAYLTSGENQKAVDGSRIEVRSGTGYQRAEIYIVPEGATFDNSNTQAVDESKVKPQARHAAAAPARHKRAAKKKATPATQ